MMLRRLWDHDLAWSFRRSPVTVVAAALTLVCVAGAVLAPWIAPQNPFDLAALELNDAFLPPAWANDGRAAYLLGTDNQGRDILSTILHGARVSLIVGLASVLFAMLFGVAAGLLAGYFGGRLDAFIMRVADVQLSFPAFLIALLITGISSGVIRTTLPTEAQDAAALAILVISIGLSKWVDFARTVRGSTMVERNKEYVQAARVIGRRPLAILLSHVLPNVMGPVLVIATISIGLAIITEATLSFLGVGVPSTTPSLGTLIRVGNEFLNSGSWWITVFPGAALVVLVLSVNLLGDWLRDALNPRLR
jgi:peptide/nickel transport system permease protein